MPKVSVVIPIYNGAKYLSESIDSIIAQTFTDWELLAINEFGSNDGSAEIILSYAKKDSRIKLIQNDVKLGLGDSINRGIREAKGEYIARLDADDLAYPERFEKQVKLMDSRPDIGVCGTYQHHFGPNTDWVHKPPTDPDQCRANFLFYCDICHSTLMLRRDVFVKNNLFYNNSFLAEDFELWSRAICFTKFITIPEVLGEYRWGNDNITKTKMVKLNIESGHIVAASLMRNLGLEISDSDCTYFRNWNNPFNDARNQFERQEMLENLEKLLRKIYQANKEKEFYKSSCLLNVIAAKWRWAKYNEPWNNPQDVASIDEIFDANYKPSFKARWEHFLEQNPTFSSKVQKIFKKIAKSFFRPFRSRAEGMLNTSEQNICNYIESKTWDRYLRIDKSIGEQTEHISALDQKLKDVSDTLANFSGTIENIKQVSQFVDKRVSRSENNILQMMDGRVWKAENNILQTMDGRVWKAESNILKREESLYNMLQKFDGWYTEQSYHKNLIPFHAGEKIRIVFFFQVASFWPSWESFYNTCVNDSRFDVKMVLLDDIVVEKVQMRTAKDFLTSKGIPFIGMESFNFNAFKPHIIVYQTPYDDLHRIYSHWSENIKAKGIRIVYIPYGIEISDTVKARCDHYNSGVIQSAWRIYTFSKRMQEDYYKYSDNYKAVKALGHPKFDGLYHKEQFTLSDKILAKAGGRKICLWKVHFPNIIQQNGNAVMITPDLLEYIRFAKQIVNYPDLFFIFLPHPKFREACQWIDGATKQADKLFASLQEQKNVHIFQEDDYRSALVNADYIITDRSAVMVEAGAIDVPVLFMQNSDYQEPVTPAIEPLIRSYYHGFKYEDMIQFVEDCRNGKDPKKEEREKAFHECIPYFDGNCGERIAEDIAKEMENCRNELD